MGEKGNLLDTGEEVFASLVEQGPQFWIAYEQYRQARAKGDQAQAAPVAPQAAAHDPAAERTSWPAGD